MKKEFISILCGLFCIFSLQTAAGAASPPTGAFRLGAEIGLGYDSNIYEAPDAPYTDYAAIGGPAAVTPVTYSGFFMPIALGADYTGSLGPTVRFPASYRFWMNKYVDSARDNADRWTQKLRAGLEVVTAKNGKKEDTVSIGPYLAMHKQTYYDHDTGSNKVTTTGEDIAGRYSYRALGVEAAYKKKTTKLQFSVAAGYEKQDYEDPVVVSQYDNSRIVLGGDVAIPLAKRTELTLGYTYSTVDYNDRHARNALGQLFASAPLLSYTYHGYGLSLRSRLGAGTVVYLDYNRTDRTDEHVGYNDYTKDEYAVRLIYTGIRDTRLRAKVSLWNRDYPNAFAFDDATQPQKTYDGVDVTMRGEYRLNKTWGLWAELKSSDRNSSDRRYAYSKYQALAGVSWEL